jgi:hypothetical protein
MSHVTAQISTGRSFQMYTSRHFGILASRLQINSCVEFFVLCTYFKNCIFISNLGNHRTARQITRKVQNKYATNHTSYVGGKALCLSRAKFFVFPHTRRRAITKQPWPRLSFPIKGQHLTPTDSAMIAFLESAP